MIRSFFNLPFPLMSPVLFNGERRFDRQSDQGQCDVPNTWFFRYDVQTPNRNDAMNREYYPNGQSAN